MLPAGAARPGTRGRAPLLQVLEQWTRTRPPVSQGTGAADAALQSDRHGEHVLPRPCPDPQPWAGLLEASTGSRAAPAACDGLDRAGPAALSDLSAPTAAVAEAGPSHTRSPQ